MARGGGCTPCHAGQFKAAAGDGHCSDCAAGQGSWAPFTSCIACGPDQFSANAGDPCWPCDATSETTDSAAGQTACGM